MRVDSIFGTEQAYCGENTIYSKKDEEQKTTPLSWQPDNVNISDEARAAYAALMQDQEQGKGEPGADEEFAEYMKYARGENPGSSDPKEQIEKLEKHLEKLQSKLAEVAQSSLPEDAKQAQIGAINAEIEAVFAQIAGLTTQMPEEA